jgi:U3 small nucleolar RNA-associated protein 21
MCAVAHESAPGIVSIIDMHADRKARTITDLSGSVVTAMSWSRGGRWLAIASADKRMIIYDVPTAAVVDRVEFSSGCCAIGFTTNNAQIITTHSEGKGAVRVWQNIALLEGPGIVSQDAYKIDEEPKRAAMSIDSSASLSTKRQKIKEQDGESTLFAGSRTKWQQILKLDEIKERNKPRKAPEKPKNAPFFLPVKYKGVEPVFVAPETPEVDHFNGKEAKREPAFDSVTSPFIHLVVSRDYDAICQHFLALEPAGVHLCIAELEDTGDDVMESFISFLASETRYGRNLDLVATWTSLFLTQYGSSHLISSSLRSAVADLNDACELAHLKFNTRTNELQCLLKVAAALQLHR